MSDESLRLHMQDMYKMLRSSFLEGANSFKNGTEQFGDDEKAWQESDTRKKFLDDIRKFAPHFNPE